eukprot:1146466-Pelagomonas_calceolata.AAC.5
MGGVANAHTVVMAPGSLAANPLKGLISQRIRHVGWWNELGLADGKVYGEPSDMEPHKQAVMGWKLKVFIWPAAKATLLICLLISVNVQRDRGAQLVVHLGMAKVDKTVNGRWQVLEMIEIARAWNDGDAQLFMRFSTRPATSQFADARPLSDWLYG